MPRYSLILPCYNVSKYIVRCLESIIKNDMSSCEILLVDDGSSDDTVEKCRDFIRKKCGGGVTILQGLKYYLKQMPAYHLQET